MATPGRPVPDEDKARVLRRYAAGGKIKRIAAELELAVKTVRKIVREAYGERP
jgi:DNA-binding NarL/FixJ family response regulator